MQEIKGDLFEQVCDAICITTNGSVKKDGKAVMGAGVALIAKNKWEGIDEILGNHLTSIGNRVVALKYDQESGICIVAFPVKDLFFRDANFDLIKYSCEKLVELADLQGWTKVCLPRPGCGYGNRTWEEVKPILDARLDNRFIVVSNDPEPKKDDVGNEVAS